MSEKLLMQDSRINDEALKEIFHMLMVINPTIEIYLLDPEGKILAFSAPPGKVKRQTVDLSPVKTYLSGDFSIPIMGDDPREPTGKKVFSVARIPKHGKIEGYLYVILGGETYDSVVQKLKGSYILTREMIETLRPELTVMHPLPRVNEITTDVDDMPGAAYFRQAKNGVYIRMALIALVLGKLD